MTEDKINQFPDLVVNNKIIQRVDTTRFLGLETDSKLSWNQHIDYSLKKIIPYVGVFGRIRLFVNLQVRRALYFSFVHSNLIYLLPIWSGTTKKNLEKIKTIQNKAVRVLFYDIYKNKKVHTIDLYKILNLLRLDQLIEYETTMNIHKIVTQNIKTDIKIKFNKDSHKYNTRNANKMRADKQYNKYGTLSILTRGIRTYNSLITPIKKIKNINSFKRKLKKRIFNKQIVMN